MSGPFPTSARRKQPVFSMKLYHSMASTVLKQVAYYEFKEFAANNFCNKSGWNMDLYSSSLYSIFSPLCMPSCLQITNLFAFCIPRKNEFQVTQTLIPGRFVYVIS